VEIPLRLLRGRLEALGPRGARPYTQSFVRCGQNVPSPHTYGRTADHTIFRHSIPTDHLISVLAPLLTKRRSGDQASSWRATTMHLEHVV
jgi:hypothetical protein